MSMSYKTNQDPFPAVFVHGDGGRSHKTQVGLLHVGSLGDLPQTGDYVHLGRSGRADHLWYEVHRREIHYKPAEANEPAVIDFVEVFVR